MNRAKRIHLSVTIFAACMGIIGTLLPVTTSATVNNSNWDYAGGFLHSFFTFRSSGHKFWFVQTMLIVCLRQLLQLKNPRMAKELFRYMSVPYFLNAAVAFVYVVIFHRQSQAYSIDCIWFNFVIGALLYYLGKNSSLGQVSQKVPN